MVNEVLSSSMSLVIPSSMTRDMNKKDIQKLMTSYGILEQAKDAFLNREITFEEYICLCEKHEVNVDSYMESIEHNLIEMKLM